MTRTKNALRNAQYALAGQLLGLLIGFVSRKVFVVVLSSEYLGLNGLFSNILSVLALAELGVGTSIVFSLYKPIAEQNIAKIKSLMQLYRRAYRAIGCVVFGAGCLLTPFLQYFVGSMPNIPHIRLIYLLYVVDTSASYFFTYKRSFLVANQQKYITTLYHYGFFFCLNMAQIAALLLTRSFFLYYGLRMLATVLENVAVSRKADQLYPFLRERDCKPLPRGDLDAIRKNVSAMLCHKIGGVVVNATDNLLISRLVGVAAVGLYSNYLLIRQAVQMVTDLLFESAAAGFGNLNVEADAGHKLEVFQRLHFLGGWVYGFCAICLWCLFNPFIGLWLGPEYRFPPAVVCAIVCNFYLTGMRRPVLSARDAMGLYWYDRYKPLAESAINLTASILLGLRFGVLGILLGTLVSTLCTCFWVEPWVLYRRGLGAPLQGYFLRYAAYTAATLMAGAVASGLCALLPGGLAGLALRALVCCIVPNLVYLACFCRTKEFRYFWGLAGLILKRKL